MTADVLTLRTAGAVVSVESSVPSVLTAVRGLTAGADPGGEERAADVRLVVEARRTLPSTRDLVPVTRGVWYASDGEVLLESAGGSGFTQAWTVTEGMVTVRTWWDPSLPEAAAARALRARFRALRAQILLHYPALWWAALHGMAPLHVSVVEIDGVAVLLAGPGGVGKSSLVARELDEGASATCDNLAACDGSSAFGVLEPLRLPAGLAGAAGARAAHGRREARWRGHVDRLDPDLVVVVRRGAGEQPTVRPLSSPEATRALVAGTLAAGELRRFWPLCAVLGLASARGPVLPPLEAVARQFTDRLPCYELVLGRAPGERLSSLLGDQIASAYLQGARK